MPAQKSVQKSDVGQKSKERHPKKQVSEPGTQQGSPSQKTYESLGDAQSTDAGSSKGSHQPATSGGASPDSETSAAPEAPSGTGQSEADQAKP